MECEGEIRMRWINMRHLKSERVLVSSYGVVRLLMQPSLISERTSLIWIERKSTES